MNDKILDLNTPGKVVEVSATEADDLGAFQEDALTEEDALEATEETEE